jgi:hypothetical protein
MQYCAGRNGARAKNEEDRTTRKKMKKSLQIESLEENPSRKYNTFKPPSSSDFQNADDKQSTARRSLYYQKSQKSQK